jgi:hypothetical protein
MSFASSSCGRVQAMLWTLLTILLLLWIVGLAMDVAGGFIHVLLVVAAIILLFNLLSGRRTTV